MKLHALLQDRQLAWHIFRKADVGDIDSMALLLAAARETERALERCREPRPRKGKAAAEPNPPNNP